MHCSDAGHVGFYLAHFLRVQPFQAGHLVLTGAPLDIVELWQVRVGHGDDQFAQFTIGQAAFLTELTGQLSSTGAERRLE